jgi:hypothetical protein
MKEKYETVIQKLEHEDRRKMGAAMKQNLYVDHLN